MTFEKAVRFVEPLLASEVAKKADFFAPEASHPKKCYNEPFSENAPKRVLGGLLANYNFRQPFWQGVKLLM